MFNKYRNKKTYTQHLLYITNVLCSINIEIKRHTPNTCYYIIQMLNEQTMIFITQGCWVQNDVGFENSVCNIPILLRHQCLQCKLFNLNFVS